MFEQIQGINQYLGYYGDTRGKDIKQRAIAKLKNVEEEVFILNNPARVGCEEKKTIANYELETTENNTCCFCENI